MERMSVWERTEAIKYIRPYKLSLYLPMGAHGGIKYIRTYKLSLYLTMGAHRGH